MCPKPPQMSFLYLALMKCGTLKNVSFHAHLFFSVCDQSDAESYSLYLECMAHKPTDFLRYYQKFVFCYLQYL